MTARSFGIASQAIANDGIEGQAGRTHDGLERPC